MFKIKKKKIQNSISALIILSVITNISIITAEIHPIFRIDLILIAIEFFALIILVFNKNKSVVKLPLGIYIYIYTCIFYLMIGLINVESLHVFTIVSIFKNIIIIIILLYQVKDKDDYVKILKIIKYSGLVLAVLGIFEFFGISIVRSVGIDNYNYGNRIGLTFVDPNIYGMTLVICYACTFNSNTTVKELLIKLIMLISIAMSMSRSAFIIVGLITLINIIFFSNKSIHKKLKNILMIGLLVSTIFIILASNDNIGSVIENSSISRLLITEDTSGDITNGRGLALKTAINAGLEHPIFGVGIHNLTKYNQMKQSAHNMYINLFGESGIIPLILYLIFMAYLLIYLYKFKYRNIQYYNIYVNLVITLFMYNLFSHTLLFDGPVAILLGVILCQIKINSKIMLEHNKINNILKAPM